MKRKVLNFDFGQFQVRMTSKLVDVETKDKQWKQQFSSRTKEYAQILFLIDNKEEKALKTLIILLYQTRLIASDNLFLTMYQKLLKEYLEERTKLIEVSEEEDKKIIEEEKAMHSHNEQ